ncbi:protein lplB [Paenibacillus pectinilyticus]|uniref:Protein lplB n=1 Tax=Paenibacillus pectinilyticus TaxID=512399 RepID=A0A1C0ZSC7_9BACL|nr:protein lplB [Paenibacillus pectinilyticus]
MTKPLQNSTLIKKKKGIVYELVTNKWLYIMLFPAMLYFFVFKYIPMLGVVMAFENYNPVKGMLHSDWVGFKNFTHFFGEPTFWMLFRNTLLLALYSLLFYFPLPIILALLLNEVRKEAYKRFVQTVIYIPHFISWVVVVSMSYLLLTTEGGAVNNAIAGLGFEKIPFLLSSEWFRPTVVLQLIWKDTGWGTIIFLAALSGVDTQLYEAATMDGAGRSRQLWHITLPAIRSTIVILLILRLGHFLDVGFEHVFLMLNSMNREVGEVFETYVYRIGLTQGQYSYSAAVGLFKSAIGLVLVLSANWLAKRFGEEGVY